MDMKLGVCMASAGALLGVFLMSGEAHARGLTRTEQKRVLTAIDSECADTWCEGDYEFSFDSIRCEMARRTCRLEFRAGLRMVEGGRIRYTIKTHCALNGIAGLQDLLKTTDRYETLQESAYEQINECIDYRLNEAGSAAGS